METLNTGENLTAEQMLLILAQIEAINVDGKHVFESVDFEIGQEDTIIITLMNWASAARMVFYMSREEQEKLVEAREKVQS